MTSPRDRHSHGRPPGMPATGTTGGAGQARAAEPLRVSGTIPAGPLADAVREGVLGSLSIDWTARRVRVDLPEVEFVERVEPAVRVVGIPDTVALPGDVREALDHLAAVCRTAYGMGVEVEGPGGREVAREALETIRRYLV